jgi:3-deoxy-D-manno-octulosonate 8-phosphate phosphatase (KDO 8-P phosphatase)
MTEELKEKLCSYKGFILDADGVFFSGHEYRFELPDGHIAVMKKRSFIDGQGLSFLRALGIKVVFATGEGEPLGSIVKKINMLPSAQSGAWAPVELFMGELKQGGKISSVEVWLHKHGLSWEECAYMGDDRTDTEAMQRAGLKIAPANVRRLIRKIADFVTEAEGGEGAIREFAEMTLDARGVDETTLPAA